MTSFPVGLPDKEGEGTRAGGDCPACGAPHGYPPAGPCDNHGTAKAVLVSREGNTEVMPDKGREGASFTRLGTNLGVEITTVAPNERGEIVLRLEAVLFDDGPFEAWLTPDEARFLAGHLVAQAESVLPEGSSSE